MFSPVLDCRLCPPFSSTLLHVYANLSIFGSRKSIRPPQDVSPPTPLGGGLTIDRPLLDFNSEVHFFPMVPLLSKSLSHHPATLRTTISQLCIPPPFPGRLLSSPCCPPNDCLRCPSSQPLPAPLHCIVGVGTLRLFFVWHDICRCYICNPCFGPILRSGLVVLSDSPPLFPILSCLVDTRRFFCSRSQDYDPSLVSSAESP